LKAFTVLYKKEYATIRQLESTCFRVLKPMIVLMFLGLLLCFTVSGTAPGVVICLISAVMMGSVFVWMIQTQKRPRRDIRCPYCSNLNSVFEHVEEFDCDICHRPVAFSPSGMPIPADGSMDSAQPKSVYDQEPS